jgi:hypothetical protein
VYFLYTFLGPLKIPNIFLGTEEIHLIFRQITFLADFHGKTSFFLGAVKTEYCSRRV